MKFVLIARHLTCELHSPIFGADIEYLNSEQSL
jgi:hypothetical protein